MLDDVLRDAPVGVYIDHPERGCIYANHALAAMFGCTREAMLGFGWARRVHPDDAEMLRSAVHAYEHDLGVIDVEYRVRHDDGSERWVHATVQAIVNDGGEHVGSLGTVQDITRQRQALAMAHERQRMETAGRLAGRVAHDFNNLLSAIMVSADLLLDELAEPAERDHVDTILQCAEQARGLTDQLLVLSGKRVAQGKACCLDVELERLDPVLRRVLRDDLRLRVKMTAGGAWIGLDAAQVGQLLLNLITNAQDASSSGDTIHVETSTDGTVARLTVRDEGAGMAPDIAERAFEPFYSTKSADRGTGLGLPSVRDIVTAVRGQVALESRPGEGTTVTIELPLLDRSHSEGAPLRQRPPRFEGARVLLVEDHAALRQSLGFALSMHGYELSTTSTLAAARQLLSEGSFDAIVSDVLLPDGYGSTLLDESDVPTVLTSGFVGAQSTDLEALPPRAAFLGKPFRPYDLLVVLARLLAARRSPG
ncbi:MAG: PAS domain-containing protein [Myxococcales bacterium]|nr:PAS domain-containing protein [Myxococcales bacterium]